MVALAPNLLPRCTVAVAGATLMLAVAAQPTSANEASETIGYVGGSITSLAVVGYETLGGDELWATEGYPIGGGTIFSWAETGSIYFARFDEQIGAKGAPASLWWQLAAHDHDLAGMSNPEIYAVALDVLEKTRDRVGDIPVYASAMARYAPETGCYQRGHAVAPRRMEKIVNRLLDQGLVEQGPPMPRLLQKHLNGPASCHQNDLGRARHGQVLLAFFGP